MLNRTTSPLTLFQGFRPVRLGLASCSLAALLSAGCVRPEPLSDDAVISRVGTDLVSMYTDQAPVSGPIGLNEAIARALKYNLDKSLKTMERELVDARLASVQMSMLPQMAAKAGWRGRNTLRGSSSRSLITGNQSLEVSTSEDLQVRTTDLHVIWNVLDFGLTYFRSRQEADQVLIAEERRMKTIQNLIQDVRDAYWRAVAADRLAPEVKKTLRMVDLAIARSSQVTEAGIADPGDELKLQHTLLVHKREMTEVRRKMALAKGELAALMNLAPGTPFELATSRRLDLKPLHIGGDPQDLAKAALANRPELREEDYKGRIADVELKMVYVRLLPGIELSRGNNYDSNSFLNDARWIDAGAFATKNLMDLVAAPRNIAFAEKNIAVADQRRLALSMAIVTQVHLALQKLAVANEVLAVTSKLLRVDARISEIAATAATKDGGSMIEAVQAQSQRVVTQLQHFVAYADVQNAYGRVQNSVGVYRIAPGIESLALGDLTAQVGILLGEWRTAGVVQP